MSNAYETLRAAGFSDEEILADAGFGAETAPVDDSYGTRFKANLVAAADAASLGLADEGAALVRSILPGYGSYGEELSAIRGGMKDHAQRNPYEALVSSIIGGGAAAPLMPGSALAATGAKGVLPTIKALATTQMARNPAAVKGWASTARHAGQLGAYYGGAYGFGSGEGGALPRLLSGAIGAGIGGAGGAGIGALTYGAVQALQSPTAQKLLAALREGSPTHAAPEAGAILPQVAQAAAPDAPYVPPKEYAILARRLRGEAPEQLEQAAATQAAAVADNSPMWLPESANSPNLTRLLRYLHGNEASMDDVGRAIDTRKDGALDRVTNILDEMSPERSPVNTGGTVQAIIGDIKDEIIKQRREAAAPIYNSLRNAGPFESDEVKKLIGNKRVRQAIDAVRKDFPEYDKLSDTAFEVLDNAKQWLYGQAEATNNTAEKRFIDGVRNKLTEAMDNERPAYAEARAMFEEGSMPLTQLFEGRHKPLVDLASRKSENVGIGLLGLEKQRLTEIADEFGAERAKALVDAARAALQGKIEAKTDGKNLVSGIVDVKAMREKLRAIIGDDAKYERLMTLLGREDLYARSANKYHVGSTTAGNLAETANYSKTISALEKAYNNPIRAVADWYLSQTMSDDVARKLAAVLTDPAQGVDFYQKMLPWMAEQRARAAAAQAIGQPAGQAAGVIAGTGADKLTP